MDPKWIMVLGWTPMFCAGLFYLAVAIRDTYRAHKED